MPSKANINLAKQCKRNYEGCLWNSTILFLCLRWHRRIKAWVTVTPIILGTTPGINTIVKLLSAQGVTTLDVVTSCLSFVSGMTPLVYNALKLDSHLDELKRASVEYRNLQDRFQQLAECSIHKPTKDFESEMKPILERLEEVRRIGLTTPEWALSRARKKIEAGHYNFDVDETPAETQMTLQVDTESATSCGDATTELDGRGNPHELS
jgi:hypothetical protein